MNKHLITLLFLLAAVVFYIAGMSRAGAGLLVMGVLSEGIFWVRLFRHSRKDQN